MTLLNTISSCSKVKTENSDIQNVFEIFNAQRFLVIIIVIYTSQVTKLLTVKIINKKNISKCDQHVNEKHCCLK